MAHKPIIGITLDSQKDSETYRYSEFPWYALRKDYSKAIADLGAIPILVSHEPEIMDDILDMVDGILFTGGDADVHPKFYGRSITSPTVTTNITRSQFEIDMTLKAMERTLPIFGICNGLHVINVACGGTLIQDIPSEVPGALKHLQPTPKNIPYHSATISEGTLLDKLSEGQLEIEVNSTHHQAIDDVAPGFVVSATAPDGIIEAIEKPDYPFLVGIEWHPEYMQTQPLDRNLFKEFVAYARTYKANR